MTKKNLKVAVAVALGAASVIAHAQTSPIRPAYSYPGGPAPTTGPASIALGATGLYATPYIGLAAGHDDNLFLSSSNEKKSNLYIVSPGFKLDSRTANSVFQLSYQGQVGRYTSSQDDNYVDHAARAQLDTAFTGRMFMRLGYDYIRGHDPRGSTDRAISGRPDKYRLYNPNATFAFGAPGAPGRFEVYYSDGHKKYINNRATTVFADRDTTEYGAAFYWRVMPRTYLLFEARQTDISYEVSSSPFSGEERRYFVGATWEATAATTGTFKIGRLERKFHSGLPSTSSTAWEGLITWAPRTYSTFDFYTTRSTNEATGFGTFIITDVYGANWTHAWSSVFNTGVLLRYQKDDYQGFTRNDKTTSIGLKAGYRFRRWLTLGAEVNHAQRDSSVPGLDYDKNLYLLTATASM